MIKKDQIAEMLEIKELYSLPVVWIPYLDDMEVDAYQVLRQLQEAEEKIALLQTLHASDCPCSPSCNPPGEPFENCICDLLRLGEKI